MSSCEGSAKPARAEPERGRRPGRGALSVAVYLYMCILIRINPIDQSVFVSTMKKQSRSDQLKQAYPWMSTEDRHAWLAYTYTELFEVFKDDPDADVQAGMDALVEIAVGKDEHWMRDRLAVAREWCLF